jgi:hypothetical protein
MNVQDEQRSQNLNPNGPYDVRVEARLQASGEQGNYYASKISLH